MKPDWKDAPEWAQWLAMDDDGSWTWFKHQPTPGNRSWWARGTMQWSYCAGFSADPPIDWKDTLEPRPDA